MHRCFTSVCTTARLQTLPTSSTKKATGKQPVLRVHSLLGVIDQPVNSALRTLARHGISREQVRLLGWNLDEELGLFALLTIRGVKEVVEQQLQVAKDYVAERDKRWGRPSNLLNSEPPS